MNDEIIFMAFRYALGRMTYVVGDMVQFLIENWHTINEDYKKLIQDEIKEAIEKDRAGMQMDVEQWQRILQLDIIV